MLGVTLPWTSIPSRGSRNNPKETRISFGLMGHLAFTQTLYCLNKATNCLKQRAQLFNAWFQKIHVSILHPRMVFGLDPPTPLEFPVLLHTFPLSAYEVQNKFSLFKRPFKMEKRGVFLFFIFSLVPEIFTILYYANQLTDDITSGSSMVS